MDATFDFAPSTDAAPRKSRVKHGIENLLEDQSDQLLNWSPVAFRTAEAWFAVSAYRVWDGSLVAAALAALSDRRVGWALLIVGLAGELAGTGLWHWREQR